MAVQVNMSCQSEGSECSHVNSSSNNLVKDEPRPIITESLSENFEFILLIFTANCAFYFILIKIKKLQKYYNSSNIHSKFCAPKISAPGTSGPTIREEFSDVLIQLIFYFQGFIFMILRRLVQCDHPYGKRENKEDSSVLPIK